MLCRPRTTVLLLLFISGWSGWAAPAAGADLGGMDPFLTQLVDLWEEGRTAPAVEQALRFKMRVRLDGPEPLFPVILEPWPGRGAESIDPQFVEALGARVDATSADLMRVLAPLAAMEELGVHPDVSRARAPYPHVFQGFGAIETEAVDLTLADTYHDQGYDGSGVKIAVVDGGFEGLTALINDEGELPQNTQAVIGNTPVSWSDIEIEDEHGTGVAEQAMDMAPGAELYCIFIEDGVDFQNATAYMDAEGIQVANHSMGWVANSYYDDTGPVTGLVNASHDYDDVFWAVSSGNFAPNHWRGAWSDDGDGMLNFDGSDDEMEITNSASEVGLFLNWDQYAYPETDLDLFVYTDDGTLKASSEIEQDPLLSNAPLEYVMFNASNGEEPYVITVELIGGPTANLDITLIGFDNDLEFAMAESSLMEPADAHGATTVGAVEDDDYDASPSIESYSSQGPTNDGRLKPELTAPDATRSSTYGNNGATGTSFSSPVVAGAAALLLDRYPALSPDGITEGMMHLALDVGDAGDDTVFGAGLLMLGDLPCTDGDGDGYGNGDFDNAACGNTAWDCDDGDASIHPGATDTWYDGEDTDCDGASDYDADGDGYDSDGYGGADCDDDDSSVHPNAADTWYDGVDSDCGGENDYDADGDGYESEDHGGTDCDDEDDTVHPDAAEICDGLDNDCDPATDEQSDADGDGVNLCGGDCDDSEATVYLGHDELCDDGLDNDCDGEVDEDDCVEVGDDDDDDDDDDDADDDVTLDDDDGDDDDGCECSGAGESPATGSAPLALLLLLAAGLRRRYRS